MTIAFLVLFSVIFTALYFLNKKPVAGFYGISEKTRAVIEKNLQSSVKTKDGKRAYDIIVLDDTVPLQDAMKSSRKLDILFVKDGANAQYAYNLAQQKNLGFPKDEVLSGMTSSIKQTVTEYKDKKYIEKIPENLSDEQRNHIHEENRFYHKTCSIPILLDNYEIDVHFQVFNDSKVGSINYWKDLETLSDYSKKTGKIPVLFAGGDDRELLNIVGALTEALSGRTELEKAVNELQKSLSSNKKGNNALMENAEKLISEGNAQNRTRSLSGCELLKRMEKERLPSA